MKSLSNFLVYIVEKEGEPKTSNNHFGENGLPTPEGYELLMVIAINCNIGTGKQPKNIHKGNEEMFAAAIKAANITDPDDISFCMKYCGRYQKRMQMFIKHTEKMVKNDIVTPPVRWNGGHRDKADFIDSKKDGNKDGRRFQLKIIDESQWDSKNLAGHLAKTPKDADIRGNIEEVQSSIAQKLEELKEKANNTSGKENKKILSKINEYKNAQKALESIITTASEKPKTKEARREIAKEINSLCNKYPDIKKLYINASISGRANLDDLKATDTIVTLDPEYLVCECESTKDVVNKEYEKVKNEDIFNITDRNDQEEVRLRYYNKRDISASAYEKEGIDIKDIKRKVTIQTKEGSKEVIISHRNGRYVCTDLQGNSIDIKNARKLFRNNPPEGHKPDNNDKEAEVTLSNGEIKKVILKTGPQGGKYYLNKQGNKVYVKMKNGHLVPKKNDINQQI